MMDLNEPQEAEIIPFPEEDATPPDIGNMLDDVARELLQSAKTGETRVEFIDDKTGEVTEKTVPMSIDQKLDIFKLVSAHYIGIRKIKPKKTDDSAATNFNDIKSRIEGAGKR